MVYLLKGQETERLYFRKAQLSDFNQWLLFFKDPTTSVHWAYERTNPETECKEWFEKQFHRYANNEGGMNALIEKSSNLLIGYCGLLKQYVDGKYETEIAYSLLPQFWNKGYATEAAIKCRNFAFENQVSSSLISIISLTNTPSQKVALKMGMYLDKTTVYKNGNVLKNGWWFFEKISI